MKRRQPSRIALPLLLCLAACSDAPKETADARHPASDARGAEASQEGGIAISPTPPTEVPGGAADASLSQAAEYAWNQFIALNWPAVAQTGEPNTRDTPDTALKFGDQSRPLVWQTFRSKVELYPWYDHLPPGTTEKTDGKKTHLIFDYDAAPEYFYSGKVPPCDGGPGDNVAWVNLDEISQISLNYMFNGSAGAAGYAPSNASDPTLIRFLAKGNRVYSDYITDKGYYNHGSNGTDVDYFQAVQNFTNAIETDTPADPDTIVDFPVGTIMVKSAWRVLTNEELDIGAFHTAPVRFYEKQDGETCYYQEHVWGLVALHIVQKTPGAPTFTFATFEQKDNIKDFEGQPVENAYGELLGDPSRLGDAPTTPEITHTDTPQATTTTAVGNFCHPQNNPRLFYKNIPDGLPVASDDRGGVCVNYRRNRIPQPIIDANRQAQQKIQAYSRENGIARSPWANYKLVNVQFQPFNTEDIDNNDPNRLESTYYQANIVVETNYTLQQFAGRQTTDGQTSSYSVSGDPARNVYVVNAEGSAYDTYNMGGCMGCHGNAQVGGSDFSFTLREGPVLEPEAPDFTEETAAMLREKYKF